MILDFVKCRIEAFNREQGGGVAVSKDDTGYILTGEDTGMPVAKLRRKGKRGEFQVLYWNRETGRWRMVSLFGGRSSRSMKHSTSSRTTRWSASGV